MVSAPLPDRSRQPPSGLDLVVMRACMDRAFRDQLLANPHQAIQAAFGIDLPATLRLRFCEKDPDVDIHIVLPVLTPPGESLTEQELDGISAGSDAAAADHWLASRPALAAARG